MQVILQANDGVNPMLFCELVGKLYARYPFLIHTKCDAYRRAIDPHDPAHRFGTLSHILVFDGEVLCAHASVVVDSRRSGVMFVGHIESDGQTEAIPLLFGAIDDEAKRRGAHAIVGPVDRTLWRTFRTPIGGNGPPFYSEPYSLKSIEEGFRLSGYSVAQESISLFAKISPLSHAVSSSPENICCSLVLPPEIPKILSELFRIAAASFQEAPYFFPIGFDKFCHSYGDLEDERSRVMLFVAKKEEVIVGFLLAYRFPEARPPGVVAKTMAILPEFQHQHIGGMLLRSLQELAISEGFAYVYHSTMRKENADIHAVSHTNLVLPEHVRTYALFEKRL